MEKQKVQVHMLPTKDKNKIVLVNIPIIGDKLYFLNNTEIEGELRKNREYQHLYFTSDEKIKEGDYVIQTNFEKTHSSVIKIENEMQEKFANDKNGSFIKRKIVATTDTSLWEHDDTVPYPKRRPALPQIPQSFLKQYVEADGKIDEVDIEMEEYLDQTYSKHGCYKQKIKVDSNICIIVHSIKDSWNREEVIKILKKFEKYLDKYPSAKTSFVRMDNWIEKNL